MSKTVLVVDDSLYMRTMISTTLSEAGYNVIGMASNGEEAIDMALELQPDLVTLDNILPDMIGTDILRVFKDEQLKSTVVMVSAVGQDSVMQLGMELGAAAYIVKPFTSFGLLKVVNEQMAVV